LRPTGRRHRAHILWRAQCPPSGLAGQVSQFAGSATRRDGLPGAHPTRRIAYLSSNGSPAFARPLPQPPRRLLAWSPDAPHYVQAGV